MKAQVKKDGVLIPKKMLKGVKQVEIQREAGRVVVMPLPTSNDPILRLGRRPVKSGTIDAAEHHDRYLYDNE